MVALVKILSDNIIGEFFIYLFFGKSLVLIVILTLKGCSIKINVLLFSNNIK